ncbi:aldehyde dehydrogenase [Hugenholtzia roseola]|uniref:aldehyde dehydrogenase n=1 Tax=Hugenholtzia roseola TaxID=1002 RepID=UPI0003F9EF37|nr:aldehyde dehydrogenase [Hugenholtzia roseola]
MATIQNYIDGALVPPLSANYWQSINPASGKSFASYADSDKRDIEMAVLAAESAFPLWSRATTKFRSDFLLKIADKIEENLEKFALAESLDTGKPLALARKMDIPRAIENLRFFATAILHDQQQAHYTEPTALNYTLRHPVGVVACISPWNLPLYLFTWKIAPALAAGCTVVGKPSEITPYTAFLFSQICVEVGLPKGVLNIVHGLGEKVGEPLIKHSKVKAISFTGGTATGKRIATHAAPLFKKLSLELGGKNANVIFADCDLEEAVENSLRAAFLNQGQICLCGSRIFVEKSIYETFKERFIEGLKKWKVGNPLDAETQIGAVVSEAHLKKVLSYIELAKGEGGKIIFGGKRLQMEGDCQDGFFLEPTIIENLSPFCRTNQEEIFGLVVTLTPFESEQQVLTYANSTDYGLATTLWTNDLKRAHRLAAAFQTGIVWVNCWLLRDLRTPFGGMKASGVGREGGFEALHFFTETQNVCIKL